MERGLMRGELPPMNETGRDYFLADDLSGALDAAGAFHAAGRRVRIVWTFEAWDAAPADVVVAFTTETRNAAPAAAAATVTRALEHGIRRGDRLWYKKIDSTLRGQVAAEVGALLTALPDRRVLFAPANPAVGRTVQNGALLVNGVPVAETEFGRDPASPVRTSSIHALLNAPAPDRVIIADVATDADLDAAVEQMQRAGGPWVAIGSGALARPVAALHRRATVARGTANLPEANAPGGGAVCRPADLPGALPCDQSNKAARGAGRSTFQPHPGRHEVGPRFMICGSAHPANREQAERLTRECGVRCFEIPVAQPGEAGRAAADAARKDGGAILMIQDARTDRDRALEAIAIAAGEAIADAGAGRVFITGGETAFALCTRLGLSFLDFATELEPGMSLSLGQTPGRSWRLAIKPGGFGDPQTWIRAWRALGEP